MRGRLVGLVATIAATSVAVAACTAHSSPGGAHRGGRATQSGASGAAAPATGVNDPANIPDAAALQHVTAGLPADPVGAVDALVNLVFGADAKAAVAAAGALLVRSGIPLVSAAGPVIALPSAVVIVNGPTDVEILPALVDQVRQHVRFTTAQLLAMTEYVGLSLNQLTPAQFVGTLAAWGKDPQDPAATVYAAATVRALAARHSEVFTAAGVPDAKTAAGLAKGPGGLPDTSYFPLAAPGGVVDFDPLQVLLFLSHALSAASTKVRVENGRAAYPSPAPSGHSSLVRIGDGPCDELVDVAQTEAGTDLKDSAKSVLQDRIKVAIAVKYGTALAEQAEKAFSVGEKLEDVASYLLFVAGLGFDLSADKARTHFRHESADTEHDVLFTAHAYFALKIPQQWLSCWTLAGLEIPKNSRGLEGFRVDWSQPNGTAALQAYPQDSEKMLNPVVLDKSGTTTLKTYPRREASPPRQGQDVPVATVYQQVRASLDKDYFGAHLSDLLPLLAGPEGIPAVLISVAYNNIVALIKKAGLPSKQIDLPVDYHGSNIFTAKGEGSLNLYFYATVGLRMDLYSCSGPEGPWQGTVALTGDSGALTELIGRLVGQPGHGSEKVSGSMSFQLDPNSSQPQKRLMAGGGNGVQMAFDAQYVTNRFTPGSAQDQAAMLYGRLQVGEATWLYHDVDMGYLGELLTPLLATNSTVAVLRVNSDARCPGASLQDDRF